MKCHKPTIRLLSLIVFCTCYLVGFGKGQPSVSSIVGEWTETQLVKVAQTGNASGGDTSIQHRKLYSLKFTEDKHFHYSSPNTSADGYYQIEGNSIRETIPASQSSAVINIIKLTDHTLVTQTTSVGIETGKVTISTYTYTR